MAIFKKLFTNDCTCSLKIIALRLNTRHTLPRINKTKLAGSLTPITHQLSTCETRTRANILPNEPPQLISPVAEGVKNKPQVRVVNSKLAGTRVAHTAIQLFLKNSKNIVIRLAIIGTLTSIIDYWLI